MTQRSDVGEARTRDLRSRVKYTTTEPLCSLNFFEKCFQEYYKSVKQFGSRSGPTFCRAWPGSNCFQISSVDDAAGWKELIFFSSTLQYQRFYCLDAFELTICLITDKFHFLWGKYGINEISFWLGIKFVYYSRNLYAFARMNSCCIFYVHKYELPPIQH